MKLAVVAIVSVMCVSFAYAVPYDTRCSGVNEVYSSCGSACPLTCDNYRLGPVGCARPCQRGCFCRPGFVRNTLGVCVETVQCTKRTVRVQQSSVGYYPGSYYGLGYGLGYAPNNLVRSVVY
ncbi:cysteine-rich venom protein 6-like [Wyeomyia smithii]|uniref:cysteine-rich venom protein 6-like n=1 Tax=Wyeomyia smithii TaxID=174621 RepID=UPI002467F3BE|nr:cysteine-rich venom protein 6-like [Wyeomyia smithii]